MKAIFYIILFTIIRTVLSAQLIVTQAGSLNTARWAHESQKLMDGRIIAFGGDNCDLSTSIVFKSSEIYNPATNTWSVVAPMNAARTSFASAILNDGRVIAIGGRDNTFTNVATCEIYDVINNVWTTVSSLNEARAFHKAVKLNDGRVLVVGGDSNTNTAEIYDPYSNTWSYTDTLAKRHFSGISVTGQGILSGGSGAPTRIESFNSSDNSWSLLPGSLITGRNNHSSIIEKSTGSLIIFTGEATYKKTEGYQFSNNTSYNKGNLLTTFNNNTPIAFDNDNILIYGIGDITAPSNTKCLQLYGAVSNSWTAGTYNFVGADVYGINKLNNGSVLIHGGSFSTGNGATSNAILVGLTSYSTCVPPDQTLSLIGINTCYGQNPTVTVQSSQSLVTYEARINDIPVGMSTVSGNGTDRSITLNGSYIMPGDNIVSIVAKKNGCPNYYLNNNVVITASLAIAGTPTIAPSGTVLACMGDNVVLTTTSGYANYIWSYPQTTTTSNTLNVNPSKTVYVKFKDANGCTSVASQIVKVIAPTALQVGPKISVCQNQGVIQFTANPIGGTWAGSGVTSSGLFDPASVSTGTYNLTYSKCSLNATKTVSVYPITVPTYSAAYTTTAICANKSATLQISNSNFGVKYQLRNGTTLINTAKNGTGGVLTFTTSNIAYSSVFNILATTTGTNCVNDTVITQHYIRVINSTLTKISLYDTLVCLGKKALIVIDSAQAGVTYSLQTQTGINIYSKIGDGDSIAFQTGPINSYTVFNIYMNSSGCSNVYLDQSIRPKINIQTPQAFFAPSKFNIQPNQYISFTNNSPIPNSTYSWSFGAGASITTSTLTLPDSISYSTLGSKYIKLKLTTSIGCLDSLIQRVNVIAPVSQENCSEMGIYSDNTASNLRGITPDKFGNTYAFITTTFSQKNKVYSNKFDTLDLPNKYSSSFPQTIALVKYDSIGIPQWITKIKHSANVPPGNITTDSIGNIYFTFFHDATGAGGLGSILFYSIDDSYIKYNIPNYYPDKPIIFCKYSPTGKFLWAKSYGDVGSDNAQIHIDKSNNLYIRSQRHFNKFDSNGNLIWATGAPAYIDVESIDTDTIGNLYTLKTASISFSKRNPTNNNIILTSNPQIALPGMTTMTFQSHLKVNTNSAYMAGIFKGKMTFAGDTFTVNKDQCCTYVDGYVASSNLNTGQHNWLIQIRIKNNFMHIQGMDFKNNMGTVLGYLYNPNDSVFVNNEKISMPQAGYFMFNFDSLGNTFNLTSLYTGLVHSSFIISYNVKNSLTNNNVLIGVKAAANKFIIRKGDNSCITQPINCNLVNVNASASKTIICASDSVKLFGAGASSYAWSDGIIDNIYFKPPATQIYSVTGTLGICSKTSTINIVVNPLPVVIANATSTAICVNSSVMLSGSGANTYTLSDGVLNGIPFSPTVSNTYTIVGTDGNGCVNTAIKSILVNNLPNVTASITESVICIGSTTSLSGGGALTYTWTNGITNGSAFTPTASATYTVSGTDANGCVNIATKSVVVNDLPNIIAISNSTLICLGETATLSVTGANTYTWSTSQNAAAIVVSPTVQTTYTVQGSDINSCVNTTTIIQNVSLCTGISFVDETNFISIYPNPNDGILHIELNTSSSCVMIVIFNALGEELFKETSLSHHNTFNLKNLPNGIYFVNVKNEESQITKHIILNR